MSDITAVILTIGEETTQRAIDSLGKQTVLPKETIIIRNVTPFHRALNLGASKVTTPFFVQVDSDLILDENCLEVLIKYMAENVGVAIGPIRDPLIGIMTGVKMFRKKCFDKVQFENSISPDTDFYTDIKKYGWSSVHVLNSRYDDKPNKLLHTFGEHRPIYTPIYTYSKYYLLGRRYRYRKDLGGLKWRYLRLQNGRDSIPIIAQIAMAHGIFSEEKTDLLMPSLYASSEDFSFLEKFLRTENSYDVVKWNIVPRLTSNPRESFRNFYKLGTDLRKNDSPKSLRYCMEVLDVDLTYSAWIAKVGLCHGIFSEFYSDETAETDYYKLKELL